MTFPRLVPEGENNISIYCQITLLSGLEALADVQTEPCAALPSDDLHPDGSQQCLSARYQIPAIQCYSRKGFVNADHHIIIRYQNITFSVNVSAVAKPF